MHVGRVIVRMNDACVGMPMRVLADDGQLVRVIVMSVVVPMRVLVLRRCVRVLVFVLLGDVKIDADREASGSECGQDGGVTITEHPRDRGAHEWRELRRPMPCAPPRSSAAPRGTGAG